ncbi:shikimate dehydrogenase [Algirhabdus cladophorae]|uniref:shikimate dehydrogenase n=1 Tax=Algirhabdus cladophorae TaxID=3377108 RepID=UPI003B847E2C
MNASIPLAAVLGTSTEVSKSPRLFQYWMREYGLLGHYIPINVEKARLEQTLRTLPELGFVGVNVTVPHKELALEIADIVTDRAAIIGAANTLIFRTDGKIHADNTDGYGFTQNLVQGAPDFDFTAGPAVVLGAGGASRAVIAALLEMGVPKIFLSNRTRHRAETLRTVFGARIEVVEWVTVGNFLEQSNVVVNTTSLGMKGKTPLRVPLDGLRPGTLVTDIVYTPLETDLLKTARQVGCPTVDGVGMLLHQAVPGFERWFGHRPEVTEDVRQVILA